MNQLNNIYTHDMIKYALYDTCVRFKLAKPLMSTSATFVGTGVQINMVPNSSTRIFIDGMCLNPNDYQITSNSITISGLHFGTHTIQFKA